MEPTNPEFLDWTVVLGIAGLFIYLWRATSSQNRIIREMSVTLSHLGERVAKIEGMLHITFRRESMDK